MDGAQAFTDRLARCKRVLPFLAERFIHHDRALQVRERKFGAGAYDAVTRPCAETVPPWSGGPDLLKLISPLPLNVSR